MADTTRLEELRRRVREDPASFAFAALAEEYRKAGRLAEAAETCRTGLARHASYHSARVTLARVLLELGEADAAGREFEQVLRAAPQNLFARKGLAEVLRRRGDVPGALAQLRAASTLAPQDPDLREALWALERTVEHLGGPVAPAPPTRADRGRGARQVRALERLLHAVMLARR